MLCLYDCLHWTLFNNLGLSPCPNSVPFEVVAPVVKLDQKWWLSRSQHQNVLTMWWITKLSTNNYSIIVIPLGRTNLTPLWIKTDLHSSFMWSRASYQPDFTMITLIWDYKLDYFATEKSELQLRKLTFEDNVYHQNNPQIQCHVVLPQWNGSASVQSQLTI